MKLALVTGATSGLGEAVCKQLAREPYHIVCLGRDIQKLERLDDTLKKEGGQTTLAPLDLLDYAALYRLSACLGERFSNGLDLFVGCAATSPLLRPLYQYMPQEWEITMGINCTANWHLMRALWGLFKRAENPTAVFVTDKTQTSPYWGAYNASKRALESLVEAFILENTEGWRLSLFSPPPMRTPLRLRAMPSTPLETDAWTAPETVALELLSPLRMIS